MGLRKVLSSRDDDDHQSVTTLSNGMFTLEMCMGMEFPMGMGIPWESHGNGNKTRNWEWEWDGMEWNGKQPQWEWELPTLHSHGNLFPQLFLLRLAY